jgi:hypothetical protein
VKIVNGSAACATKTFTDVKIFALTLRSEIQ